MLRKSKHHTCQPLRSQVTGESNTWICADRPRRNPPEQSLMRQQVSQQFPIYSDMLWAQTHDWTHVNMSAHRLPEFNSPCRRRGAKAVLTNTFWNTHARFDLWIDCGQTRLLNVAGKRDRDQDAVVPIEWADEAKAWCFFFLPPGFVGSWRYRLRREMALPGPQP